jgi:PadR family transcriptional regulator, regulatory protein PadR
MRKHCSCSVLENFFEPGVLCVLLEGPNYGYEIQKKLSGDCICNVNTSNLYRCLSKFQKLGYVTRMSEKSPEGPKRYRYTITEAGRKYLEIWIRSLEKQKESISTLITNYHKLT